MIEIEYAITPQDYVRAQYLHVRPRRWLAWVGVVLLIMFVVTFGITLVAFARSSAPFAPLLGFVLPAGYLGAYFLWYLPWRARRLWRQQKGLHGRIRMRISDEGVFAQTENGQMLTPWDHIHKWKEGRHLFLLYHADVLFQMIPKRVLDPAQNDAIRDLLVARKRRAA